MSRALLIDDSLPEGEMAEPAMPRGNAVSGEAEAVRDAVDDVRASVERSQSLFGRKAQVFSEIWQLVSECSQPGWDGAGAQPVDRAAACAAMEIVRALPDSVPPPDVAAEPDGAMSLDWLVSRSRVFSVSVDGGPRLAFAWLDGSDRGYRVVRFDGERVPRPILDGIAHIVREPVGVRAR